MKKVSEVGRRSVKRIAMVLLCVALLSGTVISVAAWIAAGVTTNYVDTAFVKGIITEEYQQDSVVYPGGTVAKISRVVNTGSVAALTRVKVDKTPSWEQSGVSSDAVQIEYNGTDWLFHNGYYYYKKILRPGEKSSPLTHSFSLSQKADNSYAGLSGEIILNMEMIQAGGGAESVWNIDCDELGITLAEQYEEKKPETPSSVIFLGCSKGFLFDSEGGDLFKNFKNMIPGETVSQTVTVVNNSGEETEMQLWAEKGSVKYGSEDEAIIEDFLCNYSMLTVRDEYGNVLYKGGLLPENEAARLKINLGSFLSGEEKTLFLNLQVLPEANNVFSKLKTNVDWGIKADGAEAKIPDTSDSGNITVTAAAVFLLADIIFVASVFLMRKKKIFSEKAEMT